jgi:hypothetical protein
VDTLDFYTWWRQSSDSLPTSLQKSLNTFVELGAWSIWKTRNDAVFNGKDPRISRTLILAQDEAEFWVLAGKKGLGALVATRHPH